MSKKIYIYIGVLFITLVVASCSKFSKISKSTNMEAKYVAAMTYYNKKDYFRALQLFEELITIFRGTARGEEIYYAYSQCHYQTDDFVSAAYHFENFVKTYPNSIYAEKASFLNAYCYYLDSPIASLDQSNTVDAIKQFQIFVNRFPESKSIDTCNIIIDELRFKLEEKSYQNARLYYKTEDYKAATVAFGNVIRDYPATRYKEECLFIMVKSSYFYARQSIDERKIERFSAVAEHYTELIESYPQSKYLKDAGKILEDAKEEIIKVNKRYNNVN